MTVPLRAALYLRVSTARQAEHDVSIPDQKRQGEAYCVSRGYQLVETYVEPGASATNDRRPEFQRMIEAGTSKPAPFDVVIVHSFSRFFRDHFELEFYVRKLAKNAVKLVSITQEMGDDPMHVMMRQIMALFDEYQSKENAKHVIRALKENARQGFWNGSLPPRGRQPAKVWRRQWTSWTILSPDISKTVSSRLSGWKRSSPPYSTGGRSGPSASMSTLAN
jgi:DNA invertase Pin-like site-specific DNA recombinase